MNNQSQLFINLLKEDHIDSAKGINPFAEFSCCVFKKCCKKYKRGKRCKKCPDQ